MSATDRREPPAETFDTWRTIFDGCCACDRSPLAHKAVARLYWKGDFTPREAATDWREFCELEDDLLDVPERHRRIFLALSVF